MVAQDDDKVRLFSSPLEDRLLSSPFVISPVKLVYGGEALAYHAGHTVLASRVLPGEQAEVEETYTRKGVVHARPVRIVLPSAERVDAPCPYFGRCGGCQYQHLATAAQAPAKREILRETLRRLGRIVWDAEIPVHAGPSWNYRNQAEFKVAKNGNGRPELGFFEAESNRLVAIDTCPILSPRLNAVLAELRGEYWAMFLENSREIELLADDRDEQVMLTFRGQWNPQQTEALAAECLGKLAATVAIEQDSGVRVFGEPHLTYRVGECAYQVSPTSFFQRSRFLLPEFVEAVTGAQSGAVAMDLFAGVGLFTLPLARCFGQVIAAESHPPAAADLAANARAAGGNVRTVTETVFDFLRRAAQMEPDLVVMDPPRAGVDVTSLKLLLLLRPKRLHYVSCSPPTLARDLGFLVQQGYRLDSLELFDFFPQTHHIESFARLSRSAGGADR